MPDAKPALPAVTRNSVPTVSRSTSATRLAIDGSGTSSNLGTLKELISTHKALLASVRRGNEMLENDNARMAEALADMSHEDAALSIIACHDSTLLPNAPSNEDRLRWITNYLQDTLAQTLWALDVRAARLEQELAINDRPKAKQVLDMTHAAYDQIRSLLADIRSAPDA